MQCGELGSGFTTGIAGELRAGTGCMQCGELGSGFTTGIAGELRAGTAWVHACSAVSWVVVSQQVLQVS